MKLLNRAEFLKMPSNTVFTKYKPTCFDEILIKGDSTGYNDFWFQDLLQVESDDRGQTFDTFDKLENGESIKMDYDCEGRDGLFEEDQLFAVFEKQDVADLIKRLQECL
jgi:hypothetical protein